MNKIKLFFIAAITFILSGCYTQFKTTGETYAQESYIYIDYEFYCTHCYYEMYWCPHCLVYHTSITHWCDSHYHWYINWYVPHYHYGYGHRTYYHNHYVYRDHSRHYVRDNSGLRNYGNKNYITSPRNITGKDYIEKNYKSPTKERYSPTKEKYTTPPIKRQNDRQNTVKQNPVYKQQQQRNDVQKQRNQTNKIQKRK